MNPFKTQKLRNPRVQESNRRPKKPASLKTPKTARLPSSRSEVVALARMDAVAERTTPHKPALAAQLRTAELRPRKKTWEVDWVLRSGGNTSTLLSFLRFSSDFRGQSVSKLNVFFGFRPVREHLPLGFRKKQQKQLPTQRLSRISRRKIHQPRISGKAASRTPNLPCRFPRTEQANLNISSNFLALKGLKG